VLKQFGKTAPLFTRRDVLKTLLVGTATSMLGPKVWSAQTIIDIAPTNDPFGTARIRLADFPDLAQDSGSIRIGSSVLSASGTPEGLYYPMVITRLSATEYIALKTECVHAGCVVGKFNGDEFFPGVMKCPCHGTEYDIRGTVTHAPDDAPALVGSKLFQFPTTLANGILTIRMLDYGIDLTQTGLVQNNRVQLTWLSFENVEYEVRYRRRLSDEPQTIPFALTETGPATTESFKSPGGFGNVYVPAQEGIYQIALHLHDV
jgi:nitrite reductase/ring-hydroxylating ferredoxin subunit